MTTKGAWGAGTVVIALTMTATACGGAGGGSGAAMGDTFAQPTVRITRNDGYDVATIQHTIQDNVVTNVFEAPPEVVWPHLLAAYEALGVTPEAHDESTYTAGVSEKRVRRRLGDVRMSRYMNCGEAMSGEIANQASIRLSVSSRLRGMARGRTQLSTSLNARAISADGVDRDTRTCVSHHVFEVRLAEEVAARINGGDG